ncbi:hypothetical protein [Mucilaginibacter daejeonensis]|nr:hypothetical protein [Mucilaginibacter daejeonensis]
MLTHQEILLEQVTTHPKIMNGKSLIRGRYGERCFRNAYLRYS